MAESTTRPHALPRGYLQPEVNKSNSAVVLVFVAALIALWVLEPRLDGFPPGHHGWVNSHLLAIFQRSEFSHAFVGHAGEYITSSGELKYDYFNRTAPPLAGLMHLLLKPFEESLSTYAHVAHQLYNVLFIVTLWCVFLFLRKLKVSAPNALAATFFLGSGFYFAEYKTMLGWGPEPLAVIMSLLAIATWQEGRTRQSYFLVFSASLLGMGAPAAFVFLTWMMVRMILTLRSDGLTALLRTKGLFRDASAKMLMVSVLVSGVGIGWSIAGEVSVRDVSVAETSIVGSAKRRLGADEKAYESTSWAHRPHRFLKEQVDRVSKGMLPYVLVRLAEHLGVHRQYIVTSGGLFLLAICTVAFFRRTKWLGELGLVAVSCGLVWSYVLRRVVAYHDYTTTIHLGLYVMLALSLFARFRGKVAVVGCVLSLMLFLLSVYVVRGDHAARVAPYRRITYEYQVIRELLEPDAPVYIEEGNQNHIGFAPYAPYFYLYGHPIALRPRDARYVVSRKIGVPGVLHTPTHQEVFLRETTRGRLQRRK